MKRIFLLAVMACYLCFAYFLYHRWLATELAARGPVDFSALVGGTNLSATVVRSGSRIALITERVGWTTILTPLWIADVLTVAAHLTLLVVQHAWRPSNISHNAKLEHTSGASRAILYAIFKVLLLTRLAPESGLYRYRSGVELSWWAIFSPIYAAAALQMVLHSCKTLEGGETLFRGRDASRPRRRPGFALTLDDTLAFNISLHLNGGMRPAQPHPSCTLPRALVVAHCPLTHTLSLSLVRVCAAAFYLRNATWSVVFWPLWLVAAICGVGLFLLLCFGVPMLSRRYPTRQFLMVLPPLLLLMATYSLALQALLKGISWLDAPYAIVHAADVMGPAIAAAWCLWLLLAVVTLSAMWHVPGEPMRDSGYEMQGEPPSYESLSAQVGSTHAARRIVPTPPASLSPRRQPHIVAI